MIETKTLHVCKACGTQGEGNYCHACGQAFRTKRITLKQLLHDVFHFFTHLDKGFGYTVKQLLLALGHMQRSFIEGDRQRHQKPFSMFFICATIAAVTRYWIYSALVKWYGVDETSEANFFHEYMVLVQIALMPVAVLITYLIFYSRRYNYAEIGVLTLYTVSFFFLNATLIACLKFIWPHLDTAYIELPIIMIYNSITFRNFFNTQTPWKVVLKSLVTIVLIFLLTQVVEDFVISITAH